jgi:dipeptidyl aminopeptidase/acylaminoacyl peptidase
MKRVITRALATAVPLAMLAAAAHGQQAAPAQTATPATKPAGPIPAEQFAALPFIEDPELSPDGTKIVAKLAVNGVQRLAIIPVDAVSKLVTVDPGDFDVNGLTWVNNDWFIAHVGIERPVDSDEWYLRRLMSISADGKVIKPILADSAAQNADDVLWTAHDGSPHLLVALQTSVYSNEPGFWPQIEDVDVSTGHARMVVPPYTTVMDWYADAAGVVRMGVGYDDQSKSYTLRYRPDAKHAFRVVDRASGRGASLNNVPAMFLSDQGKAIVLGEDDKGLTSVFPLDLATLSRGEKQFGVPGYDLESIVTNTAGTEMIGATYDDDRPRVHWFDPKLAQVQADLDKAVQGAQAHIVTWSDDFSVLLVHVGGGDRPGSYYLYRPADGTMHLFAKANQELGNQSYAPVRTIHYKARDGLDISAVLTLPKGKPTSKLPLIMMPHGGPFARDDEEWDWWAQFLASRGYAVLQPNYRGSSGFGTPFTRKGEGQWGLAMQDDLTDGVKWAVDQGIADAGRVCIVGGSYGGYAALRAAQRDHGVYRCAVSYAGVSDMPAMIHYDGNFLNGGQSKDYFRAQAPDLKGVSPINFAGDFSIPILIMHGAKDRVVPVNQSRSMVSRLKAAGKTYVYVEQPHGDHHFTHQSDRLQFLQQLEAFLTKYDPA